MVELIPTRTESETIGMYNGIRTFCWNYNYFVIQPYESVDDLLIRINALFDHDPEPEGVCLYVYFTSVTPYVMEYRALRGFGSQVQWRKREVKNREKMRRWCNRMINKRDKWLSNLRMKENGKVYLARN